MQNVYPLKLQKNSGKHKQRFFIPAMLLISVFLGGCATTGRFEGKPDLKKAGTPAAEGEYQKYRLDRPGFWTLGYSFIKDGTFYTIEEGSSVIRDISPEAMKAIERAQRLRGIQLWVLSPLAVAGIIGSMLTPPKSTEQKAFTVLMASAAVASFSFSFWGPVELKHAALRYNQDLARALGVDPEPIE